MSEASQPLPNPRGYAPLRRSGSVRRTTSIDITWPNGRHGEQKLQGLARDCFTPTTGVTPVAVNVETMDAEIDPQKFIRAITSATPNSNLQQLIGVETLKPLRSILNSILAEERAQGLPIYQLVSDITGCMVAGDWAWSCREESQLPEARARRIAALSKMEGVCTGFSPKSSALSTDGRYQASMAASVPPLAHPYDPMGWHSLPGYTNEVTFRRARRIDLWLDEDIEVESTFQDSAIHDNGDRLGVHEYTLKARFNKSSLILETIQAIPHILPFPECPGAVAKIQRLVGVNALELREAVSEQLRRVDGCTHLNDAARALAEVPPLIAQLQLLLAPE